MRDGLVVSPDGTKIHFAVEGRGRPLVIVPGVLAPLELYRPLVRVLADRYQVALVERRGYGRSEVGPAPVTFDRQAEDLVAVLGELDEPATVFGHSFGGLVTLAAARAAGERIAETVLYEPPMATLGAVLEPMLAGCRKAVAEDRPEDAVRLALKLSGSPEHRDEGLAGATIAKLTRLAPGLIADLESATALKVPAEYWAGARVPVTLLEGGRTAPEYARSVAGLRAVYPEARHEVLPGEVHIPREIERLADFFA
ncbi:alpha/beta hydrolase [Amycolatopsis rhabdoformis]|uniref:Alpha/beta hydrolase n=1 Tax=Amycolatopsis rhabdoformis TaxID=1448059 RepID=A0ABZ1IP39_9PSEU|nr:alpha/beta hydrolase [Amycolatopsis rhabdoformis]WSE35003.1 alpha/beta hydrolase [Amycolatopsis rhabdoformis]